MPLVLKWQGYRELRVLCKLYSRDLLYSEYSSGSKCNRVLNVGVTYGSEQNAPLEIFDSVLNMLLVLKWQGYREL